MYRAHGSLADNDRILSFDRDHQTVSIWTVDGRLKSIPFVCGEHQCDLLQYRQGESDLVYRKGTWYLLVTCTSDEPPPAPVEDVLGVDFGTVNLATDSDRTPYSGEQVETVRQRYQRRRQALQAVGPAAPSAD